MRQTYHFSWRPWRPLRSLEKEWKEFVERRSKNTRAICKIRTDSTPALLSLLVVQQVQGCPAVDHRSIKILSGWPYLQFPPSWHQWNSTREYWKTVCAMKQKYVSHISSVLSWVSQVPFLSWSPWLTSQSLSEQSITLFVKWTWCNLAVLKLWKMVLPAALFLLAFLAIQTPPKEDKKEKKTLIITSVP